MSTQKQVLPSSDGTAPAIEARPPGPRLKLDDHVPLLLSHVANMLTANAARTYFKHHGLTVTEWRVIRVLAAEPRLSQGRIAQLMGINKSSVSRSAEALIKRRLIVDEPDPTDPRRILLSLTPAGEALHDQTVVTAMARDALFLEGISDEERAVLVRLLKQLRANLPKMAAYRP